MQFLGIVGIFQESCKIIFSWRKVFSQIALALVLPLSLILLAHMEISNILFSNIMRSEVALDNTQVGTPKYNRVSDYIKSEWITLWLFKAAYLTFVLIFSLLSTSAVVYTIASIYTGREVTFNKVMSVVPKVWKRLMVTFLCIYVTMFAYNIVALLILVILLLLFYSSYTAVAIAWVVFLILYFVGVVYMTMIWQLASVVTVLEDLFGFRAMKKSKELIKGKTLVAAVVFSVLMVFGFLTTLTFQTQVVGGESLGMFHRAAFGIMSSLLLCMLTVFGLVVHTVIYFVCKSYHHENIDKSALSDHLEVYLGDYVPLMTKDVQLEHFSV